MNFTSLPGLPLLRNFYIDNFKSLVDFSLPEDLGQLTCLIGLNGSGKSTLLQAFDFLGHLAIGRIDEWLRRREWQNSDLTSRFLKKQVIHFRLGFEFPQSGTVEWTGDFNVTQLRCTRETIRVGDKKDKVVLGLLRNESFATNARGESVEIPFSSLTFHGSVLSLLNTKGTHPAICDLKEFASHLRSLDMLSPHLMHKRAKDADDVGYGGERLSAYLHGLPKEEKVRLLTTLQGFYGQVQDWHTTTLQAGWKDLRLREAYPDAYGSSLVTMAHQLNDGMLRVLAILAQTGSGQPLSTSGKGQHYRCSLFDEIENGINPAIVEKLISHLLAAPQQIIITTHSPMILNYLPDEVACRAVVLCYRTREGKIRTRRFFELDEPKRKLQLLGPGEVFVDTDLAEAAAEAERQQGLQP